MADEPMRILVLSNENVIQQLRAFVSMLGVVDVTYNPHDQYDRGVSFMHLKRITKEQLEKPWINFHPAPLPEYKGRNLCYHAIMNGEEEFGATVHYVDESFDTGRIIEKRMFPIPSYYTSDTVSKMAMVTSYGLLEDYLPAFAKGKVFNVTENIGGNYYKKEEIEDTLRVDDDIKKRIRAITYRKFYPKINIGGTIYKIVKEEQ